MRGLPALPTIFLTQGPREPWTQLRTGCLLPTHLLHAAHCPPNPTLAPTPGGYALHSSPQAARHCPPPSASALGPVVSEGRTHLHHGDAEAAHGAQRPSILQLLRGLCVQLDLLLLLRGRDAQEVLGQLSDVHLRECGVSAGPPARARLPACTTRGRRSSLQAGCPAHGAPWRPSTSLPEGRSHALAGSASRSQASDTLVHVSAVPAADQDHGKHGLSTKSCSRVKPEAGMSGHSKQPLCGCLKSIAHTQKHPRPQSQKTDQQKPRDLALKRGRDGKAVTPGHTPACGEHAV